MLIFWKVRYISRDTKEMDDRMLALDTESLKPIDRAAVELVVKEAGVGNRAIVRFRDLFEEKPIEDVFSDPSAFSQGQMTSIPDYFEDDAGKEITMSELGQIQSGNPNTRVYSSAHRPHDIQLDLATPKPIPISEISMTPEELRLLGYFERDLKEIAESAFLKDGPGTIHSTQLASSAESSYVELRTAISDDEIRSAVTIFRRLYMKNEPASFLEAVNLYSQKLNGHPYADWVNSEKEVYKAALNASSKALPLSKPVTFTRKRLIDVFLYTQYHHQPDERRQRQYEECLAQVDGKKQLLMFMFLVELSHVCHVYMNSGRVIVAWFRRYCEHHKTSANILQSLRHDNPHLGVVEKKDARAARLFREQVEILAAHLWNQASCPSNGPDGFLHTAEEQLQAAMDKRDCQQQDER